MYASRRVIHATFYLWAGDSKLPHSLQVQHFLLSPHSHHLPRVLLTELIRQTKITANILFPVLKLGQSRLINL